MAFNNNVNMGTGGEEARETIQTVKRESASKFIDGNNNNTNIK